MLSFCIALDSATSKNGGRQACNDVFGPLVLHSGNRAAAQPKTWGALERFITNAIYLAEAELVAGTDRTAAGKIDLQQLFTGLSSFARTVT